MVDFSVTTVDLLRHGKPEGGDIFRGHSDVAISELGLQQMQAAIDKLSDDEGGWQQLLTSPMQRCQTFASQLSYARGLPCAVIDDLREISFGDWDGRSFKDIAAADKVLFDSFWRDPVVHTPPNGEPMLTFCQRINDVFWQQVEAFQGRQLLMVVHGGVIRAILADILNSGSASLTCFEVPYASVTRIKIYHDAAGRFPQLVFHNR